MKLEFDRAHLKSICKKYRVKSLYVFGSQARGEAKETSDVDILYEFEEGARVGIEFIDFADELEALFGKKVDLVSLKWMSERFSQGAAQRELLYAA